MRHGWMLIAALALPLAAHAKDCSVTSTGAVMADYHRSVELDLAMAGAVSSLVPRDRYGNPDPNGVITIETESNSNGKVYGAGLLDALRPFVRDHVRLMMNGYSLKTILEWAPNRPVWGNATGRLNNAKWGAGSVGIVVAYMTKRNPHLNGEMTDSDLTAYLHAVRRHRPNARIVLLGDMGYYGYSTKKNALGNQAQIVREGHLFAERARTQRDVPPGLLVDYFPIGADGVVPNPLTGISWPCEWIKKDGIHPAPESQVPVGENQARRLRADPVFAPLFR